MPEAFLFLSGGDVVGILSLLLVLSCLCCSVAVSAQNYTVTSDIPFTGDQTYWDYLTTDAPNRQLYVTRGNEVLILDLESGKVTAAIAHLKRVHGVAPAHEVHKGFITDSGETAVVVFDLKSHQVTQRIKVDDAPDAVLFEPTRKWVY